MENPEPRIHREDWRPDPSLGYRIIFEDNHLMVVNKLPGELSQGDKTGDPSILDLVAAWRIEKEAKPGNAFVGLVHRLDRPTSGILVLTKTSKALERMNRVIQEEGTRKMYWALLDAPPPETEGQLVHWIARNPGKNLSRALAQEAPGTQEARLAYRVVAQGQRYTAVEVEIKTGRHHQIRAQFAALGLHIKGDLKYGAKRSNPDGSISLHAARLVCAHPVQDRILDLSADPRQVRGDSLWDLFFKNPRP